MAKNERLTDSKRRHVRTNFFCQHKEVIDDVFGLSREFLPKHGVLSRYADGASVQVTLAHHGAAHHYQRGRAEADFVRAEKSSNHDVETCKGIAEFSSKRLWRHPWPWCTIAELKIAITPVACTTMSIITCTNLSIGLQNDPRPEIVQNQNLVCFCDPQFPGESRAFDSGPGACPGASVVPGHHDVLRFSFCDARGHDTHPHLQ